MKGDLGGRNWERPKPVAHLRGKKIKKKWPQVKFSK
jgi:hypothetical protein